MDDILNRIIKIETSVQQMIDDAKKRRQELPAKINEIIEVKKTEYKSSADKQIAAVEAAESRAAEVEILKIEAAGTEKIARFKALCEKEKQNWIDAIFKNVTSAAEI